MDSGKPVAPVEGLKKRSRGVQFEVAFILLLIILTTVVVSVFHLYPLENMVGPLPLHHWASIIGFSLILILAPIYSLLKRKHPSNVRLLLKLHVFINLSAVILISVHFGHHLSEEINPVIDTGTGFLQYFVLIALVITGIIRRFQIASKYGKAWRFLHEGLSLTLLLMVIGHILRAFRIL